MVYFTQDFLKFLRQLEKNNNRDWFNAQKQRYIKQVKEPFELFISDLIDAMQPCFDGLAITPGDAIFRIYRDVRFSKDKSPYKTKVSAIVSPGGRKNKLLPGIYLEITAREIRVSSGLYALDSKQLKNLRGHISSNLDEFDQLISNQEFKSTFGQILGEQHKRVPKEIAEDVPAQPLLLNKQFYFYTSWPAETIFEQQLIHRIVKTYEIARPISTFLYEGIF